MKRRRIDPQDAPAAQFNDLQNIRGMTNNARREVVAAYTATTTGRQGRMAAAATQVYSNSLEALRPVTLPAAEDNGKGIQIYFFSLADQLAAKVDRCKLFCESLRRCRDALADNKLELICYVDECTAGNVVHPDPQRKAHLLYISFVQMPLLSRETQWLTMSVLRTAEMQRVKGGIATALRVILECWHDECETGIALDLGNGPRMHFIAKVLLLADAEGLRALSGTKGSSGTKPCLKCSNVLSHAAAEDGCPDNHTSLAETSHAALKSLTQTRLDAILRYIQTLRTKKAIAEAETLLGWNLQATLSGCLASDKLRAWLNLSHCHFDSMHIYFTNGMIGQELGYWWTAIQKQTNVTMQDVQSYVNTGWNISTARGGLTLAQLRACFNEKLLKKDADYRGDGDQTMAAFPLLVQFQEEILRGQVDGLDKEFDSLLALSAVVHKLQKCKRAGHSVEGLLQLQEKHLCAFQKAYDKTKTRPKQHYSLHLEEQARMWSGRILDTFTPERKHRVFKSQVAQLQTNLNTFSKSTLLQLGEQELRNIGNPHDLTSTLGRSKPIDQWLVDHLEKIFCQPLEVSLHMTNEKGMTFTANQFLILSRIMAVEILCCARAGNDMYLVVHVLQRATKTDQPRNPAASIWFKTNEKNRVLPVKTLQSQDVFLFRCQKVDQNLHFTFIA